MGISNERKEDLIVMIKVIFIFERNVEVEEMSGDLTPGDILRLAQEKGAIGCYIIWQSIIELKKILL
jgi:hypothetical protein